MSAQRKYIVFFAALALSLGLGGLLVFPFLVSAPPQSPLPPPANLEPGRHYWIGLPEVQSLNGIFYAGVYEQPAAPPAGKLAGRFRDAKAVLLLDVQDDGWCRVEGIGETGNYLEGWTACYHLLSYRPTPMAASP